MLKLIPTPYKLAAIVFAVVVIFGFGFKTGTDRQLAKQEVIRLELQEDLFDLADDISVKNAEILALQQKQEELAHELETEAYQAEGSSAPGISTTGGLQRLERRWGSN